VSNPGIKNELSGNFASGCTFQNLGWDKHRMSI